MAKMQPIKKVVIYEMVVGELIKYIKEHNLKKGDRLPTEKELTNLLGVSRTSVREALKILKGNDIIEIVHGSGIYVNDIDGLLLSDYDSDHEYKEVLLRLKELAQVRIMIETFCAVEVSKSISSEQLDQLYAIEEQESKILSDLSEDPDQHVFVSLNLESLIIRLCGNPFIIDFYKKIEELWKKYLLAINSMPYTIELRHEDHINIIKAIASQNKSKIEKAIRMHIQRMVDALDKLI